MNTRTLLNGFDIGFQTTKLTKASDVKTKNSRKYLFKRTGLNKLFGNGVVKGLTFSLSAERGCGKTTFLLQILENFKSKNKSKKVAFISNEESQEQLAEKCKRIDVKNVDIGYSNDINDILEMITGYDFVVIDSFQGIKGAKEKSIISNLVSTAKKEGCCVGVVVHRTKDNKEKGDSAIGHAVDICFHMNVIDSNLTKNKKVCINADKNRLGELVYIIMEMTNTGFDIKMTELYFENYTPNILKEIF